MNGYCNPPPSNILGSILSFLGVYSEGGTPLRGMEGTEGTFQGDCGYIVEGFEGAKGIINIEIRRDSGSVTLVCRASRET